MCLTCTTLSSSPMMIDKSGLDMSAEEFRAPAIASTSSKLISVLFAKS